MSGGVLRSSERETFRRAIEARRAFGGGLCTQLVLGTDRGRVLMLFHATTEAAGLTWTATRHASWRAI